MHIDTLYTTNIPLVKRKAAEGDAQFQLILGMMYYRGESVFHDKEKAQYWMRKSAENGNETAAKLVECLNYERTFNRVLIENLPDMPFMIETQSEFERHIIEIQNPGPKPTVREYGLGDYVFRIWARTVNPKKATNTQVRIFQIGTVLFAALLVSAMFFTPHVYDYINEGGTDSNSASTCETDSTECDSDSIVNHLNMHNN